MMGPETSSACPFHLGQGQGAEQRPEQQDPAYPELRTDRRQVEQQADAHHGHDETDRAPEADAAVALGVGRQMAEGQRLDQGQGGAPEKVQDGHAEQQADEVLGEENHREARQRRSRRGDHDAHPPPHAVSQPAPKQGRDQTHELAERHQHRDAPGRHSYGLQVQREIRQEGADKSEIPEIPDGQAAVRHEAQALCFWPTRKAFSR
jgi:hypothetical protein